MAEDLMDKLVALCKRRGYIFQSSEIYGGINGFWDYGPLGVELKRNLKAAWWEDCVRRRDDMVGLDAAIIMNPRVWEASGHVGGFSDPMVDCRESKKRYRADQMLVAMLKAEKGGNVREIGYVAVLEDEDPPAAFAARADKLVKKTGGGDLIPPRPEEMCHFHQLAADLRPHVLGPDASEPGTLTEPRQFNLMFKTFVGALEGEDAAAYLRPETAQGIFANYRNVLDTSRMKLPFGIAQIGKSFRNEINPRNYTFRSREFEQMEIEFFCHPDAADEWYTYWRDARYQWYIDHGLTSDKLRLRDHESDELAHYARACADIEYDFPFGISELEGVANRTDYDLEAHQEHSGKDLTYFDDETKERFLPYVIEPSGGVDRATLAFLCEAYTEDEAPDEKGKMQRRTVLKLHPRLAPTKLAVFPLVKKEGMPEIARRLHESARDAGLTSFYDEKGAVGRRYRRQDEAGTPFCVTVDGQTIEDGTVTVRDRDSLRQERIAADAVVTFVRDRVAAATGSAG
jgi:glycyl-tRNA synthetase